MGFREDEIRANRDYFAHKLRAEMQRTDVMHAVQGGKFDFTLLDTRGREAFGNAHVPGAWCAPLDELQQLTAVLPKDKEIVTYFGVTIDSYPLRRLCSSQSKDFWQKS